MDSTPRLERGSQSFTLPLNEHRVYIRARLSEFHLKGKECLESHIQCVPCCNDAPSAEELSKIIDDLHIKAFGVGGWIYTSRDYLPSPEGGVSCEEKSQNALSVLPTSGDGLEARLKEWKQKSEALLDKSGGESTRQLKEEEAALRRDLEEHAAALDEHRPKKRRRKGGGEGPEKIVPPSGAENLLRDMVDTMLLYNFIKKVKEGVVALQKPPSGRNSTTEVCLNEFARYRHRQQKQTDDNGEEFERTLEKVANAEESLEERKSTTVFVCRFVSLLVKHLRRQRDSKSSETGNLDSEKRMKQTESVPVVICRIVNGLHKHKGVEALVVLNALVERRYMASPIRDMGRDRQNAFVSSAIDRLASVDLSVPSQTRLFHPATLVYWALAAMKLDFATICRFIKLEEFSAVDPSSELHTLAEGWLSSKIPFAMTMPLSKCQNLVRVENNPQRARDDEKSPPTVGVNQRSFSMSPVQSRPCLLANVAGRDPTPGPHRPESPGVNGAGDVPATAAPAPHSSPVVPVDSESGAAPGQADQTSTQAPPFLSHNSGQQLVCSDQHGDTGPSLDGTQSPDQVFVGYQAGVPHAGHVSSTAVALDSSAGVPVNTGTRSGYVDPAGLRDGRPSIAYISSLEGSVMVGGSTMEMACIRGEDTGAAPNSMGNDQPRYTTIGRLVPDEVWSGNAEFMGFPEDHAMAPTSE